MKSTNRRPRRASCPRCHSMKTEPSPAAEGYMQCNNCGLEFRDNAGQTVRTPRKDRDMVEKLEAARVTARNPIPGTPASYYRIKRGGKWFYRVAEVSSKMDVQGLAKLKIRWHKGGFEVAIHGDGVYAR